MTGRFYIRETRLNCVPYSYRETSLVARRRMTPDCSFSSPVIHPFWVECGQISEHPVKGLLGLLYVIQQVSGEALNLYLQWEAAVSLTLRRQCGLDVGTACCGGSEGALLLNVKKPKHMKQNPQFVSRGIRSSWDGLY